ncbi:LytR/AlgR family response regulator transcription factor [Lewinella sp. IMCC34191]|uniref:LytR/AlgR family response regulator transcription factor n=1 Tax=Lewinella sp. IMCC34191 TaxID=2259172 RepID=UPI000E25F5F4|nr:LytTR family DNA-binding domain-containing protein [Lewinella sp. IMCC34191]
MMNLRCLVVDDERLARVELAALLAEAGGCQVVGEAASVTGAVAAVRAHRPDVVFLDIQMPEANGFSLFDLLPDPPLVVVVSAFDANAVRAFTVQAVDYLPKPVTPDRLAMALERVRELLAGPPEQDPLYVEDKQGGRFVATDAIYLVRAYDHYVRLYHGDGTSLLRLPLRELEKRLPPDAFFRCSRSEIVRVSAIRHFRSLSRGRYLLSVGTEDEEVIMSEARAVKWRQRFTAT